jgi:NAD(P)-dependent dehydrogenase (short-subunit alcohol dehydrogenase family)
MAHRVVLITGASRGIGHATAIACAWRGARVAIGARDAARLEATAEAVRSIGGEAVTAVGDVAGAATRAALVGAAVERFGRIDALVSNAGVIEPVGPIAQADPDAWARHLAINVVAPAALAALAMEHLRAARGRVVHVSSGAATGVVRGWGAYCAGKAALNQVNAVLAAEEPDVTCVAVSPGLTETDMQADIRRLGPGAMPESDLARFVEAHESGAMRTAEEVGAALAALALSATADLDGEFVTLDDPRVRRLL